MASYIAAVHKDPDSVFGVSFPDFPGCITAGDTIDEAKNLEFSVGLRCKDKTLQKLPSIKTIW